MGKVLGYLGTDARPGIIEHATLAQRSSITADLRCARPYSAYLRSRT
jgi:hypothetical protein